MYMAKRNILLSRTKRLFDTIANLPIDRFAAYYKLLGRCFVAANDRLLFIPSYRLIVRYDMKVMAEFTFRRAKLSRASGSSIE